MKSTTRFEVDREFLRRATGEPHRGETIDRELTAAVDRRLRQLITERPARREPTWRPWLTIGATALVVVAVAAVLIVRPTLRGTAAWSAPMPLEIQPVREAPTFSELAELVDNQPSSLKRSIVDWSLWTTVDGDRSHSRIVPTAADQEVTADGTVQTRKTRGSAIRSNASIAEQTKQLGRLLDKDKDATQTARSADITAIPRDTAGLAAFVDARSGQPPELAALTAFTDMFRQEPLPGDLIAAFYRLFALYGQLTPTGVTIDRLGRRGLVYQLTSDDSGLPTHYQLIIDSDTGQPLANETVLFQTSGALHLNIPAVIRYELYLDRA